MMKIVSLVSISFIATAWSLGCYIAPTREPTEKIISPLPSRTLSNSDLPEKWDWRNVDGKVLVTRVGNQNQPNICGSCWAFGSTGALSDRFKILTGGTVPDINLSPQVLLDCGTEYGAGSCNGGSYELAYEFIYKYGITDETCSPYQAVDFSMWGETTCTDRMCKNCDIYGTCQFVNATHYDVSEYGSVLGEDEMMKEIYSRGPIACAIYAHGDEFENYIGGILMDTTDYPGITHIISVVGWGSQLNEEDGSTTPYWIGRNSFGTRWGEHGWFRMIRGFDALNMESTACMWAVPSEESVEDYARLDVN